MMIPNHDRSRGQVRPSQSTPQRRCCLRLPTALYKNDMNAQKWAQAMLRRSSGVPFLGIVLDC